MNRIAIIDTAIDSRYIDGKVFEFYDLCGNAGIYDKNIISHGTVCAMVLDNCASDPYELINIRIFENDKGKVFGEIETLAKALKLCKELHIDIVSLSAVSSILSDSEYIYDLTRELAKDMVIISALDNNEYITVPTSYPHILGVRSDIAGELSSGELAYCANDPFAANIYANCDFLFLREIWQKPSNSYAVPVVAAFINSLITQGISIRSMHAALKKLRGYPVQCDFESLITLSEHKQVAIPIVLLINYSTDMCCSMMDRIYKKYDVQSSALSMSVETYDVRVREIKNVEAVNDDLSFMQRHYKTDIIFLIVLEEQLNTIRDNTDIDVELEYRKDRVIIKYESAVEMVSELEIVDRLYDVLTD